MTMLMLSYIVWNILYAAGLNDEVTVGRIFVFWGILVLIIPYGIYLHWLNCCSCMRWLVGFFSW